MAVLLRISTGTLAAVAGILYFVLALAGNRHWRSPPWVLAAMQGSGWLVLAALAASGWIPGKYFRVLAAVIATCFAAAAVARISDRQDDRGFWKLAIDLAAFPIGWCFMAIERGKNDQEQGSDIGDLQEPLLLHEEGGNFSVRSKRTCLISGAGWISRHYFLWLNPLLALGRRKTLDEEDMPRVAPEDQADTNYNGLLDELSKGDRCGHPPSLFWTLARCYQKSFLYNGIYALAKCVTLTAGPLVLKSFVASTSKGGNASLGYILVLVLFVGKMVESVSQRQWLFGSKRLGMRMRSAVMGLLYSKQLKLSGQARRTHATGEVMSYMAVDAYRIGEFGYWVHVVWTTPLQIAMAGGILVHSVGEAPAVAGLSVIALSMLANRPMARLQRKFQNGLMSAQDKRMRATSAILRSMKIVKLQAWEEMFKARIKELRDEELEWLSKVQYRKTYNAFVFWLLPVLVSTSTFIVCWLTGYPLDASNVFTTLATFRIIQEPIRLVPDVISAIVQVRVSLARISSFLEDEELDCKAIDRSDATSGSDGVRIDMENASLSWDPAQSNEKAGTSLNVSITVRNGSRVAVCGEVGSGKSTFLLSILGEVPLLHGKIKVCGTVAYVSQVAWIQSGTVRDNILFGMPMDENRYALAVRACELDKDLDSFPFGDLTEIGERGLNLSGGQKQRIQLARAVYQDASIYLLDDPFSAVDAQTGSSLFKNCILGVLSQKTVILVTHQVEFLKEFDTILVMQDGEVMESGSYDDLLVRGSAFQSLVVAHKDVMSSLDVKLALKRTVPGPRKGDDGTLDAGKFNQLTKDEKKETGDTGLTPYLDYMKQADGLFYYVLSILSYVIFILGQMSSNWWMASKIGDSETSTGKLIGVYSAIGLTTGSFLFIRSIFIVYMGLAASKSFFNNMIDSLFSAPMSFFDSTPSGRILSRISVDLSIIDLDVPFSFAYSISAFLSALSNLAMTSSVTWQILVIVVPMMYINRLLQVYNLASARELMRINGTTKAPILNYFGEAISGVTTIRAFRKQDQFTRNVLTMIDTNSSPFFHNFAAREWLIQRLELMWSTVLCCTALIMVLLPPGRISPGFVGLMLSYGLSMNGSQISSVQNQCNLANMIVSVERVKQYLSLPAEALSKSGLTASWPSEGKVELQDLKIRYTADAPLVLRGITCTFQGGQKVGVVGRTGSGKSTLISALFRIVDPVGGRILIDGVDIVCIGVTDLRSRLSIIPQEPTLFRGTVRFNLDPFFIYTDQKIWEALDKCQLGESVREKPLKLESFVGDDGENWSVGERQLFCLARTLLKSSKILVLDEATASIDNVTDAVLQNVLRNELGKCTTITVAHRIPTVISSDVVLALEDGLVVEFDKPAKLLQSRSSLFCRLVAEYWSNSAFQ